MKVEDLTIEQRGTPLEEADKVLIMLHGRGDNAKSFINLSNAFELSDYAILALQADNNTWYPFSFLAKIENNQPNLSNSLQYIDTLVGHLETNGFQSHRIYLCGFSQGACLTLEYATRNAKKYGGIIAFTGGLIGEKLDLSKYKGDFEGTYVFIGSSDHDPHVPEYRINDSETIITNLGGNVKKIIYKGMGHTINQDEINEAKKLLNKQ